MKKIACLALLIISTQTFAKAVISNTIAYTIAEAVYVTAIPIVSSGSTFGASTKKEKIALQIQNDIQDYYQAGVISALLQNEITLINTFDSALSLDESLDVLIEATEIILLPTPALQN